jgi:hypothetical protein
MRDKSCKLTFRMTPGELGELKQAIKASPDPWKGMSHHVHIVVLSWARRVLADQLALAMRAKDEARAERVAARRHGRKQKAAAS